MASFADAMRLSCVGQRERAADVNGQQAVLAVWMTHASGNRELDGDRPDPAGPGG